jgi:hypothetical protein
MLGLHLVIISRHSTVPVSGKLSSVAGEVHRLMSETVLGAFNRHVDRWHVFLLYHSPSPILSDQFCCLLICAGRVPTTFNIVGNCISLLYSKIAL